MSDTLLEQIERDRERPQVKLMSMSAWRVKSDEPAPGWVKVVGPCVATQCPTLATDLNGEDYIARHADARRIARVPDLEARIIADAKVIEAAVAENERLKDVLDSIDIYLSDTLSGRVKPDPETYTEWLIDGIKIARDRARDRDWFPDHDASAALAKGGEA